MKRKVKISGSKVHNVGYRPFLTEIAICLGLRGFEVYDDEEDGQQAVVALLEADDRRVAKFCDSAMKDMPQIAVVDEIHSEEFSGDVMPLWQFASIITATQMNKAIQILSAAEK
jgi:hydrogenase maturation factor HypF (carbamoyltransferase family)